MRCPAKNSRFVMLPRDSSVSVFCSEEFTILFTWTSWLCTQELTEKILLTSLTHAHMAFIFRAQSVNELWRQDALNSRGPKTSPWVMGTTAHAASVCPRVSSFLCIEVEVKMGLSEKIHLFSFDTEQFNCTLQGSALRNSSSHCSYLSCGSHQLPDRSPKETLKQNLKTSLNSDSLIKTARVKLKWRSLHIGWEFLPECKVGKTERNPSLTLQSLFNVWKCFEWHWEKMSMFERKATSKISATKLLQLGSSDTVLWHSKQLFKTKPLQGSGSAWC